ncbi:glycosyltransferase [Chamaesiphon sp. VAR_48_metabat_135_sub]|uniref:glycosyltransferase n=1 Tax=Chamaesiphon sp. VAR_48_metabat_135_sub TaxID=2964699 RepID=UPI00286C0FE8|nr:glycosyltransferase [Chamaesiphon sp. VAR_48_metabat_135_sub]
MSDRRIAFFLPTLAGGGAERVALNLLKGMVELNIPLDLVVADTEGPYLDQVPKGVRLVNLGTGRVFKAIPGLVKYLKETQPVALLSHMNHANLAAILARDLAGVKTKLVGVEHETLSASKSPLLRSKFLPLMMRLLYPRADEIVGVSQGVSEDLDCELGFAPGTVKTIYNPVVDRDLTAKAAAPVEHPWFAAGSPPIFLAVGRLSQQKDFANLIQAFALVRQRKAARLMILGEGETRSELEAQIETLGIGEDVSLPGFVQNPYAYMRNSTAFVLSSRWEGLPTVLIEAMACGCSVVATDCPSGPQEILAAGKYGLLVPIENATALADAMVQTLETPVDRAISIDRGMYFSADRAVSEYLKLFDYESH